MVEVSSGGPKMLWHVVAMQDMVGPAPYLGLGRRRTQMCRTTVADLLVLVLVSAAFSTGWVLRDAQARGLPRRNRC